MSEQPFIIIACPKCHVKNRLKSYDPGRIPVCPRCKTRLVDPEENDVHAKYGKSLNNFFDLPDVGIVSNQDD